MVKRAPARDADTASRILEVAEQLAQTRGFNGFSYADVAKELNVTKASLHYHFAGKAELGEALITRYAARFSQALVQIEQTAKNEPAMLEAYARLYRDVLNRQRMCLCGMLAAEHQTLPDAMRHAVVHFFDQNEIWLRKVLLRGRKAGTLNFHGSAAEAARMVLSALEGAMLVARSYGDVARFDSAAHIVLGSLIPSGAPRRGGPLQQRYGTRK